MGDSSVSLEQLLVSDNLIEANASEDDKIKAVMFQSSRCFYPVDYARQLIGLLPLNYVCFRCGIPGHLIKYCPNIGAPKFDGSKQPKKCSGIPRSFMVKVDDPNRKGVMHTNDGQFVIPIINVEAYANGKKERPPFLPQDEPSSPKQEDPVPEELLCLICQELMTDAVVIPCCRNSYCDECIRTCLLESDEHVCPTCKQSDVSPDSLNANVLLRQKVNNFTNGPGGTDGIYRTAVAAGVQVQVPQPPSATPQQYPVQCSSCSYNILSPVHASVSPNLQAPWMAPVPQPPKASLSSTVPFQSKEKLYRQQRRLKEE
ncbi:E3 ubiquitin-protein ligase RBBP6-like [Xyrauchen texanus]|uniref:E3 ubiquitin-protein ligase RBBP6-like n=1 Tax=Xyrauchen texanus TaxID=154827 RepID=UPI0022428416|nr:E3 ubiquitin-protein ligase RBBP6-like [Xyrauchen texanus]